MTRVKQRWHRGCFPLRRIWASWRAQRWRWRMRVVALRAGRSSAATSLWGKKEGRKEGRARSGASAARVRKNPLLLPAAKDSCERHVASERTEDTPTRSCNRCRRTRLAASLIDNDSACTAATPIYSSGQVMQLPSCSRLHRLVVPSRRRGTISRTIKFVRSNFKVSYIECS